MTNYINESKKAKQVLIIGFFVGIVLYFLYYIASTKVLYALRFSHTVEHITNSSVVNLLLIFASIYSIIWLFLFIYYCVKKTIFIKNRGIILSVIFAIFAVTISIVNIIYAGPSVTSFNTIVEDDFLSEYSYNNIFINRENITIRNRLIMNVYSGLFNDKYVIVDDHAYNSSLNMQYLLTNSQNHGLLETMTIGFIVNQSLHELSKIIPHPQTLQMHFSEHQRNMYFYTGQAWIDDNSIMILQDINGNVHIVPYSLAHHLTFSEITTDVLEQMGVFSDTSMLFVERFYPDEFIQLHYLSEKNNVSTVIFMHALFLVLLFSMGLLIIYPFTRSLPPGLYPILSMPVGIAYYILYVYAIGLLNIPINFFSCIITSFILLVVYINIFMKYKNNGTQNLKLQKNIFTFANLITTFIVLFIITIICVFPSWWHSNDSIANIDIGIQIYYSQGFTGFLGFFSSFSIIGPIFHASVLMFGLDFSYTYVWVICCSGILAMLFLLHNILKRYNLPTCIIYIITITSFLIVITNPLNILNMGWLLNNLPVGIFGGLAAILIVNYFITQERKFLFISILPFLMFSVARIEAPLFALLFLISIKNLFTNRRDYLIYVFLFSCICTAQFIFYFHYIGFVDSPFWTPIRDGLQLTPILFYIIYLTCMYFLKPKKLFKWFDKHLTKITIIVLLFVNVILYIFKTDDSLNNIIVIGWHTVFGGYHGVVWIFLLALVPLIFSIFDDSKRTILLSLSSYVFLFFLMLLIFGGVRIAPWRSSMADSGNRMILHMLYIVPIVFSITVASFVSQCGIKKSKIMKNIISKQNSGSDD
ncbi:MAG: hypothetical protein FWD38_00715 [Oscillospiraceae bacterium]|nr:hypothetical protein [Oscillospiraceae bacterium]